METELQSRICPRLLVRGMRFAEDSPLEGGGFEPSVPRLRWSSVQLSWRRLFRLLGNVGNLSGRSDLAPGVNAK